MLRAHCNVRACGHVVIVDHIDGATIVIKVFRSKRLAVYVKRKICCVQ